MKFLRTSLPYIVEIELDEVNVFHHALYCYKDILKHDKRKSPRDKKSALKILNHLIATVDLML